MHLGGSFEEIDAAIHDAHEGRRCLSPYVVLAQPSLFDPSRAPDGRHTAWAYCHAPHGSGEDVADLIEERIEQHAPGFRGLILAKSSLSPRPWSDITRTTSAATSTAACRISAQLYSRPVLSLFPYRTSKKNIYICSSSTPPGGGVHGLCGYYAARGL